MVVDRTNNVGFYSNPGTFKRSRYPKTSTRLAIPNGFRSTQSTTPKIAATNLARFPFL